MSTSPGVGQDLGHLGPGELLRGQLALAQHLSHLGAAEEDLRLLVVRTRLGRGHTLAHRAVEGVLEEERRDGEPLSVEFPEDILGIIGTVEIPHPGVIACLASLGRSQVRVVRRPRVAVIATGDETVSPGGALSGGEIYDSNSHMVVAMLRETGRPDVLLYQFILQSDNWREAPAFVDLARHGRASQVVFTHLRRFWMPKEMWGSRTMANPDHPDRAEFDAMIQHHPALRDPIVERRHLHPDVMREVWETGSTRD